MAMPWPSNHRKRPLARAQGNRRRKSGKVLEDMSKDIKPKVRIGQKRSTRSKVVGWTVAVLACGGAGLAAYRRTGSTEVDVPVAKVRRADFIISFRARGEIKSTRSVIMTAPQV